MDIYSSVPSVTLPRLGDTPYDLLTASARRTAGNVSSWDEHTPVVLAGDGSETASTLNGATSVVPSLPSVGSALGGVFTDALNHTLLGAAGIVLLGVGAFILLRGD